MVEKNQKKERLEISGQYVTKLNLISKSTELMKTELLRRWIDCAYKELGLEVE